MMVPRKIQPTIVQKLCKHDELIQHLAQANTQKAELDGENLEHKSGLPAS